MTTSGMVSGRSCGSIMMCLVTREGTLGLVDEVRHGGERYVRGVLGCSWIKKEFGFNCGSGRSNLKMPIERVMSEGKMKGK